MSNPTKNACGGFREAMDKDLSFDNAEDALKQLKTRQPDLIISDVRMPDIDGIQ